MADFRRLFYALAVLALLAGLSVPVRAQAPPFACTTNVAVPPIVRGEGYTELIGDITLNCTGGIPTPLGQAVPPVNFTVLLNTNITSKLLAGNLYNEALLIVDEPHSAVQTSRPILNCGATLAPDTGGSGPGVCSIISVGNPIATYDGCPGAAVQASEVNGLFTVPPPNCGVAATYGNGRPNVFQGRTGTQQNPNQFNSVTWLGVPLDPPGTTTNRTIRMTNIRADAVFLGVSSTFTTNYVQAQISVNGTTSLSINNPQQIVAFVQKGLIATVGTTNFGFLQCVGQNATGATSAFATGGSTGSLPSQTSPLKVPTYTFTEGFASSWKTKNISFITNTTGNGILQAANSYWTYNYTAAPPPTNYPADQNQNVAGAIYNTEAGFEYPSLTPGPFQDPVPNPPNGIGTVSVVANTSALSNAYNGTSGTAISGAGIASQGTRLALQLSSIPTGSIVLVPTEVFLTNSNSGVPPTKFSGVAVLTSTDANGAGSFVASTAGNSTTTLVSVPSSGLIVYEILFADPFSIETMTVPMEVAYAANLPQNLPQPGVTAQVAGSFAPFYSTQAAHNPSSTLPIPRFVPGLVPVNLFSISKCACDILFPYVVSAAGYDTGIAIANTSFDPGATFGFGAAPQQGSVQFWYYGTGANNAAPPGTQCTNTASPGTCPGTTVVPAGQVLTYVASSGSGQWGLDNRAAGFVGYVIAQAQFQYCHAFAFIGALGAGPTAQQISEGYLGLILDPGGLTRTTQTSENLVH